VPEKGQDQFQHAGTPRHFSRRTINGNPQKKTPPRFLNFGGLLCPNRMATEGLSQRLFASLFPPSSRSHFRTPSANPLDKAAKKAKVLELRQQYVTDISGILTPDQQKKWEARRIARFADVLPTNYDCPFERGVLSQGCQDEPAIKGLARLTALTKPCSLRGRDSCFIGSWAEETAARINRKYRNSLRPL
jgi:hypothetical protein